MSISVWLKVSVLSHMPVLSRSKKENDAQNKNWFSEYRPCSHVPSRRSKRHTTGTASCFHDDWRRGGGLWFYLAENESLRRLPFAWLPGLIAEASVNQLSLIHIFENESRLQFCAVDATSTAKLLIWTIQIISLMLRATSGTRLYDLGSSGTILTSLPA